MHTFLDKTFVTRRPLLATCIAAACAFSTSAFADAADAARADGHAPAGVMYEHMHKQGEFMLGYNVQRMTQDGALYNGSKKLADDAAMLTRYSKTTDSHDMYMHMLHLMYAPTDDITLMLMPMYMSMDMDMSMSSNMAMGGHGSAHSGHGSSMMSGSHSHGVDGWGDTILSASYRAFGNDTHQLITTLAFSAPTGYYKKRGSDGKPVHYGMQLGAGVWQVMPSITYLYKESDVSAGVQVSTRQPMEDLNDLGYYQGDQRQATAWVSYLWQPSFSTSMRLQYSKTDTMQGHYKTAHNHSAPADIQGNYGGEQTFAGIGANTVIPVFGNLRAGIEYLTPVNENLNGVQQKTKDIWSLSISKAF